MIYRDRTDAGRRLAKELARFAREDPIVLALPRGGVLVAAEVAEVLNAPLDLLFVRKIGVPYQPELAMGAVVDGLRPHIIRNEDVIAYSGISEEAFEAVCEAELAEIERRRARYVSGRARADVRDRVVIVVDDGIATGATTRAALEAIQEQGPKKLVLAVPVAPTTTLDELSGAADEIVCLQSHEPFYAIGLYYDDFHQISDAEVLSVLDMVRAPDPPLFRPDGPPGKARAV
jgi:putative phosphoribosyl transferase